MAKPLNLLSKIDSNIKNRAMISERNVVAKVGATFCKPSFAKIATNAAVNAARKAYKIYRYLLALLWLLALFSH